MNQDNTCVFCLDEIIEESSVAVLNCKHRFHFDCVKEWVTKNKNCPIDRSTTTHIYYYEDRKSNNNQVNRAPPNNAATQTENEVHV